MKAVIQRVTKCSVTVSDEQIGAIDKGLLVLLGVAEDDSKSDAVYLAKKIPQLRIFEDDDQKMNRSLIDVDGSILIVSQFTLLGDCRKGRRPSFAKAAGPQLATALYECFIEEIQHQGIRTATGKFGAMMQVALVNDGPVTLILESR